MEFRLLGPLEALSDGRTLPIGGAEAARRARTAAARAERGRLDRPADRRGLGPRPPKSVEASLQNCISQPPSAIGRELIETRPPGYLLNVDAGSVDALRFEQALDASRELDPPERAAALREALALWRGQPLADVEFEGVARAEVARLEELRLAALEQRIEAELALGHHDAILGEIEALAVRHPTRERLRHLQMLALYRAGRQRDALRVYQEARLELRRGVRARAVGELRTLERMIIAPRSGAASHAGRQTGRCASTLKRNVVVAIMEVVDLDGARPAARRAAAAALAEIAMVIERHGGIRPAAAGRGARRRVRAPQAHDDDTSRALRAVIEARDAVPPRFVVLTAVERLGGEVDGSSTRSGASSHTRRPATCCSAPRRCGSCRRPSTSCRTSRARGTACSASIRGPSRSRATSRRRSSVAGASSRSSTRRFDRVARDGSARRVVLAGEAGIGKTRLARAFLERVGSGATVLTGRCPAYGAGAALRPLQQILEQLGPVESLLADEPDARTDQRAAARMVVLRAERDLLGAAPRCSRRVAARRPVVIVFEDVHWAAPTFLDFVEYLVGWAAGPLLVLCVARPELLEARPAWREDAILLEPMSPAEAQELVAALPESSALDASAVAAAVDAAEGNPLFLEQLVSFAAEEEAGSLPPTLEVLIASRVDRLPEEERAVLERASVAGRHFWRSTVEATSPDDERGAVGLALMALVRRRLVLPERASVPGEDGFRFQHALIRDAVYAGVPEARRAELHESVARALDGRPELDESVGYHLECAALLRGEAGVELRQEAGRRLGAAGVRALKRVDAHAATDLLTRATALLAGRRRVKARASMRARDGSQVLRRRRSGGCAARRRRAQERCRG